jgi:hypothetical protein
VPKESHSRGESEISKDTFIADEVTGLEMYEFAEEVKERLEAMGIKEDSIQMPVLYEEHRGIFPDLEPGEYFDGRMPHVLKRLNLDQLSSLSGLMNSWHQYVVSKRSLVAVERSEAQGQRKFILSLVRRQYKDSGECSSDKEADEAANQDFRFLEADSKLAKADTVYKTLDDFCGLAKSNMTTLSRELSNIRTKLEQEMSGSVGRPPHRAQSWRRQNAEAEDPQEAPKPRRFNPKKGAAPKRQPSRKPVIRLKKR